jgi:DNA-binding Lrp family transcriptional regulator
LWLRLMDSRTFWITLGIWSVVCLNMRAYVFIDAARKSTKKITAELRQRPEVIVADVINGPHPVIACLEAENPATMAEVILFDIRKIDGVKDLTVYLSMDGQDTINTNNSLIDNILPDLSASIATKTDNRGRKRNRKSNDD